MTITVPRSQLREAVSGLTKITSSRSTLPVLSCIRFEADRSGVSATGTDLDQTATYRFDGAGHTGTGAFLLPIETIKPLTKGDARSMISFEQESDTTVLISHEIGANTIELQQTSVDNDEWPGTRHLACIKPSEGFLPGYRRLVPFASTDTTRHVLGSVFVDPGGKGENPVSLTATDGKRLTSVNSLRLPVKAPCIVPVTKFLAWSTLGSESGLAADPGDTLFTVESGPWLYTTKSIEGTYPNWRQVVPGNMGNNVIRLTDEDADALGKILPAFPGHDRDNKPVTFVAGSGGRVIMRSQGAEDAKDTTLELKGGSRITGQVAISVNRAYLLDALVAGFREFASEGENCPLMSVDGSGGTHVLMPIHVATTVKESEAAEDGEKTPDSAAFAPESAQSEEETTPGQPVAETPGPVETETPVEPEVKTTRKGAQTMTEETRKPDSKQTALERALEAFEQSKAAVREAASQLATLAAELKNAVRDQKAQASDLERARATLGKLQAISL